jgi:hypothetical protein
MASVSTFVDENEDPLQNLDWHQNTKSDPDPPQIVSIPNIGQGSIVVYSRTEVLDAMFRFNLENFKEHKCTFLII